MDALTCWDAAVTVIAYRLPGTVHLGRDECAQHAEVHEHCRVRAESCRRCEAACRELLSSLG